MFFRSDTDSRISHTGIYLGGGSFIHASSSAGKVIISSMSPWYERNFVLGRRVF
jgi:cell wall-associated NlpC family hydrolase